MKKFMWIFILICLAFVSCKNQGSDDKSKSINGEAKKSVIEPTNEAHQLIIDMVDAVGGQERLYSLNDVEYTYTYHNLKNDLKNISTERYLFNGELSWGLYNHRGLYMRNEVGTAIQGHDGKNTWVSLEGEKIEDPKKLKNADFTRKTNFFWFIMMYKLLDEGIIYEKMEDQMVGAQNYHRVKISYDVGVGDVQDTYLLYINPESKLVDQFLFTVMDFEEADPYLMMVEYEEVEGLKLMTHRKYRPANWEGEAVTDSWAAEEFSTNIKFNNGFKPKDFIFQYNE